MLGLLLIDGYMDSEVSAVPSLNLNPYYVIFYQLNASMKLIGNDDSNLGLCFFAFAAKSRILSEIVPTLNFIEVISWTVHCDASKTRTTD